VRQKYVTLFFLSIVSLCAFADRAWKESGNELALIVADRVNLRAGSSLSALVKKQLEFGSWVTATNEIRKSDNYS